MSARTRLLLLPIASLTIQAMKMRQVHTRRDAPIDPVMLSVFDGRASPVCDDGVGTVVLAGGRMRLRIRVPETGDAGQTGVTLTSSGEKGRMKREGRNAHFTHFIAPIAVHKRRSPRERADTERASGHNGVRSSVLRKPSKSVLRFSRLALLPSIVAATFWPSSCPPRSPLAATILSDI